MSPSLTSINPATGKEIKSYTVSSEEQVAAALATAANAYKDWSKQPYSSRAAVLKAIAAELRKDKENLAALATIEMGKPIQQGREEVEKCAVTLDYYADNGEAFLADVIIKTDASKSYVTYRPLGAILAIMPWNFPFWQVFRAFGPIAMGGNVVLLKHASNVSGCALAIEELVLRAGAYEGLLQTLLLPSSQINVIIAHPVIAGVTLTGSTTAGRKVAEAAGRNLKRQVLELGGSDAYVVLEDVDIDDAATICVNGRLKNSGQSCVAAKRFVVAAAIKEQMEQAMVAKMSATPWGDPMEEHNIVGPMAREDLRDALHEQVQQSLALGARLLCGGYIPDMAGAYYPPTVLTDVKKGMPAYDEELFGPVAAIIVANTQQEAMDIANDSEYGLGGSILSGNVALAERLAADELQAGSCFVNDFVHSDHRLPFGGIKNSGYGREIGTFGIKEFMNVKTVYVK